MDYRTDVRGDNRDVKPVEPTRCSQVGEVCDLMSAEIEVLAKHVGCLENRITAILRNTEDCKNAPTPVSKYNVGLALSLQERVEGLQAINRHLQNIIERVEL